MSSGANSWNQKRDSRIRQARAEDVEALTCVIDEAFVVERPFIEGDRIDGHGIREFMEKGIFLIVEDPAGTAGCVYCELRGERGYLGLLAVYPERQGAGLGRDLMQGAEEYFRGAGCCAIDLRIVSARSGLREFYEKRGYEETGTTKLHPQVPAKVPFHFINMTKTFG
jgi:GNAT superfamily N-acetyltransferase